MAEGSERPGAVIDKYKLVQQIGEGGFGVVYLAEQAQPVRRQVALKVIKLGMDTKEVIARFNAERQALAMMEHPNIAKVLDAGATEAGRPYFVMELVKGEPITDYCDRERVTTRKRLELFIQVCHAVQHAHQKGIIHRDIKPSNVMIALEDGKPMPKVIDFGIAKATDQRLTEQTVFTQLGQFIGTPEYMSPEQAEMSALDIDTRSDVYSLGVLLYELLTGTTPFDAVSLRRAGLAEIQRIIREVEPPRPSTRLSSLAADAVSAASTDAATLVARDVSPADVVAGLSSAHVAHQRRTDPRSLGRMLRGDIDWIIMKALEKDRTRRYETANGLAADIARHLTDEPVTAGPPSASYRLSKFVKRNRGQVIAGVVIAAMLILGVIGTSAGMVWAWTEKDRADEQTTLAKASAQSEAAQRAIAVARAEELELVADFQSEQLSAIDAEAMGANLRRSLLDAAPEAERDALAGALASINFTDLALTTLRDNIFERTIEAIDFQFKDQPLVQAKLLQTTAATLRLLGLLDLATAPQERALAIRRLELGDDHPDTLASISNIGLLLSDQGKLDEAEAYHREALEGSRRVLGNDHPNTLMSINNMGFLLKDQGKLDEAEPYAREALESSRRVLGDDHPDTLDNINNMGSLLSFQGKLDEAEPYYREALEGRRRVLGDDHPQTLSSISNMSFLLGSQGKLNEAEAYCREALEGSRRALGNDHPDTLISMNNMGSLLRRLGKLDEAEPYFREALEGARRVLGDDHPDTLRRINNMGGLLSDQGRLDEAEAHYREALEGSRRVLGNDHSGTLTSINNMASLLQERGKLDEAESYYREALEGSRRVLGDDHPRTLAPIINVASLLRERGKLDEAESLGDEAVRSARETLGEEHWIFGVVLGHHARTLAAMGRFADAEARFLEAYPVLSAALGEHHAHTRGTVKAMADFYTAWDQAEPGNGYDIQATEWRAKLADDSDVVAEDGP